MNTRFKTVLTIAGVATTGALILGGTAANAANTTPTPSTSATECTGPASSLTGDQCSTFLNDIASVRAQRDAVFVKYGLTAPTGGDHEGREQVETLSADQKAAFKADMEPVRTARDAVFAKYGITAPEHGPRDGRGGPGGQGDPAANLTDAQRSALRTDMTAFDAQRDAVFAKYGITAPTEGDRGDGREGVREQVEALSADQQAAFKADMEPVREARDAAFAEYGITAPEHGPRDGQGGPGGPGHEGDPAADLTDAQRSALRTDMTAVEAQRDAVFAKYGITASTEGDRGDGGQGVRDQVEALSADQQAAFKADIEPVREARDAAFAEYGITAPEHGPRGGQGGGQGGPVHQDATPAS